MQTAFKLQQTKVSIYFILYPMNEIVQHYDFDPSKPIGTPYQDAQVKNHSYKAKRKSDGEPVQLIIYQSTKSGQIHSYHKKISKLKEIKHPNLVPIRQCLKDSQKNQLFIVLEWSEGYCIKQCLKDQTISERVALKILKDVLEGLKALNKAGMVHSFVNIQNLQLFQGKARLSFRNLIYKTYYLAPEIRENHQKSFEADLFSLGICLYRLVFGSLPFKPKTHEQYLKNVKAGISRKLKQPNSNFPTVVSQALQEIINKLCHLQPNERLLAFQSLAKFKLPQVNFMQGLLDIVKEAGYRVLYSEQATDEYLRSVVVNFKSKHFYYMDILRYNLTELSSYVDEIVLPFQKNANSQFANVHQFIPLKKDSIAIIYAYCSQGSLKDYRALTKFDQKMAEEVQSFLNSVLTHWKGQYRYLDNQQILIKKGKPILKYPPFPNKALKERLKLAKDGSDFYAPELQSGVQSQSADSWSVGVIDYWMRCDCMPTFNAQHQLIIKNKQRLSPEKIEWFNQLIVIKAKQRKNIFRLQDKPNANRKRSDSYDDVSSGIASSPRTKFKGSRNHSNQNGLEVINFEDQQLTQDNLQILDIQGGMNQISQSQPIQRAGKKKNRRGTEGNLNQRIQTKSSKMGNTLMELKYSGKVDEHEELEEEEQHHAKGKVGNVFDDDSPDKLPHSTKITKKGTSKLTNQQKKLSQSTHKLCAQDNQHQQNDPARVKNRFDIPELKQLERYNRDTRKTKASISQSKVKGQGKKGEKYSQALAIEPQEDQRFLDNVKKEGWNLAKIQKHWSKPFRIVFKCFLAILIYILVFYLSYFSVSGSLLKNRYEYTTQQIFLKSTDLSTVATVNFTLVTKTPSTAYTLLNNKTLTYVRDSVTCTTNTYWVGSNILQIIQSSGFGAYQAIGIILSIFNLLLICIVLAKLDLPKAISYCSLEDNIYVPLYNWLIANLGLASLTSMTYLIYGGLFHLQLQPCISWTTFPSLRYIFRQEISSFVWRFIWIYMAIIVDYILIFYVIAKPKVKMHKYLYGVLIILYMCSLGARGLGTYGGAKESVMGGCGELLALLIGLLLFLVDLIISCKLRKLPQEQSKSLVHEELNLTQAKLSPKK